MVIQVNTTKKCLYNIINTFKATVDSGASMKKNLVTSFTQDVDDDDWKILRELVLGQ
jgi:hypothetical protein